MCQKVAKFKGAEYFRKALDMIDRVAVKYMVIECVNVCRVSMNVCAYYVCVSKLGVCVECA